MSEKKIPIKGQGIYKIRNKRNDKYYVGRTVNCFSARWTNHRGQLRNNKHSNRILQQAWNKYGEDAFEFIVLEDLSHKSVKYIHAIEQWWLRYCKGQYNISSDASKSIMAGVPMQETTKRKIGIANSGKNNGNYGRSQAGELAPFSKLIKKEVLEIRSNYQPYKMSYAKIGKIYNVSASCIQHVIERTSWRHI